MFCPAEKRDFFPKSLHKLAFLLLFKKMSLFTEIALRALLRLHTQRDSAMTIRDLAHVEKI
jgi:hypothetical protein